MTRRPSPATQHAHRLLHAHLDATDIALRHAHAQMVKQVQPALTTLLRDIDQARAKGEDVNITWLMQHGRLAQLKASVTQHAQSFEEIAQTVIAHAQQHSETLGTQSATMQLREKGQK